MSDLSWHKPNCPCGVCKAKRGESKGINSPHYGKQRTIETRLKISKAKQGDIPWNKGLTKDIDERVKKFSGKNSPVWKGDDACERAFHTWITNQKPKPSVCQICKGTFCDNKNIELINLKNHIYTRNPDDYTWAGHKCHFTFDEHGEKIKKIMKEKWNDTEYRNKRVDEIRKRSQKPEFKQKISDIRKENWKNLEYRNKMLAIMRSEDYKQKQAISQKKRWSKK